MMCPIEWALHNGIGMLWYSLLEEAAEDTRWTAHEHISSHRSHTSQ
jgi:hypothetical protein